MWYTFTIDHQCLIFILLLNGSFWVELPYIILHRTLYIVMSHSIMPSVFEQDVIVWAVGTNNYERGEGMWKVVDRDYGGEGLWWRDMQLLYCQKQKHIK